MRIDGIGIQKTGSPQAAGAQSAALETGDVLTATVQRAEGDAVVLKTSDGKLLNARLAENAALNQNDKVEFLVTQSGREGLVLRIVYVEPQAAAAQAALSEAESALLQALAQSGAQPDARTLAAALALVRQNGLTPKAALFFASNRLEPTPERLAAYRELAQGRGPGEVLYDAAKTLSEHFGEPLAAQAPETGATQGGTLPAAQALGEAQGGAPVLQPHEAQREAAQTGVFESAQTVPEAAAPKPETALNAPAPEGAAGEAMRQTQGEAAQQAQGENAQASAPAQQSEAGGVQGAKQAKTAPQTQSAVRESPAQPPQTARKAEAAATELKGEAAAADAARAPQGAAQGGASVSAESQLKELPARILGLFLELTGNEGGEDVKKFVSSSGERLEALKFMAGNYDEESVRSVQPQLERAEAQTKLAQDVTRFVCYQLPVHNGEYGTAELYVYRRAKNRGKIDADNATVLISIPTESFGRVETLLRAENKSLAVTFSVERESGIETLKEGVRELRKTLGASTDYRLGEMRVTELKERTTVENAEAVLSGGAKKTGSIDLKI